MNRISFLLVLLCHCLWVIHSSAFATESKKVVRFAINTPGSAPYLYFDTKTQDYQGVLVDFFSSLEARSIYVATYMDSSRARNEQLLLDGQADVFLSSPEWLDHPTSFIFSDPIMVHASYIYSTRNFDGPFVPQEHPNASVCTRYGFIYPVLQTHFEKANDGLVRVDSSSQTTMAAMLSKNRCDFAIMSEQNALSIMFDDTFCRSTFYQSPNIISAVDLVIVVRPGLEELQQAINIEMKRFIESGEREKSIERHSGRYHFPKQECSTQK